MSNNISCTNKSADLYPVKSSAMTEDIVEIKNALMITDDETKKQALTRLLNSVESQLDRLQ